MQTSVIYSTAHASFRHQLIDFHNVWKPPAAWNSRKKCVKKDNYSKHNINIWVNKNNTIDTTCNYTFSHTFVLSSRLNFVSIIFQYYGNSLFTKSAPFIWGMLFSAGRLKHGIMAERVKKSNFDRPIPFAVNTFTNSSFTE